MIQATLIRRENSGKLISSMTTQDDVLSTLTGILKDGIDIHRCAAATALGQLRTPDAVEALIEALRDEDEDVRTDAAAALKQLADPSTAGPLLENLIGDPCGEVKTAALDTLVALRSDDVVPWLRRMVRSRDEEIVWGDDEYYEGGWDDWIDLQVKSIEALGEFGCEEAVPDIVEAMQDEMGQDLSEVGFRNLVKLGDAGVAAAVGALSAPNERLRRRVIRYLAESPANAAQNALAKALHDDSMEVRTLAAEALASRDAQAPELEALFDDESDQMRALAVTLLGAAQPDRLRAALEDKAHRVRRAGLTLLAEQPALLAGTDMVPVIVKYLGGDAPKTAAISAAVLAAIDPEGAVDDLTAQAMDGSRFIEVRLAALRALIGLDDPRAVDALAACISDSDRQIRLESLAGLAGKAAVTDWPNAAGDVLIAALNVEIEQTDDPDEEPELPDPAVEIAAAQTEAPEDVTHGEENEPAMEDMPKPEPKPAPASTLEAILGADSPELQVVKGGSDKVELSPKDLEFLGLAQRKLKKRKLDPIPRTAAPLDARRFAAKVLGDVPRAEVAVALIAQTQGADMELAVNALDSLARMATVLDGFPETVEEILVGFLNGKDENRRLLALRALAGAGGKKATHALNVALDDADSFLRLEAVRALAKSGRVDRERMSTMLDDPDSTVRLAAAEALASAADDAALERLADFTFAFEGYHHRETARLLRDLDPSATAKRYLQVLGEDNRKREWQVAIAALGELNEARAASA